MGLFDIQANCLILEAVAGGKIHLPEPNRIIVGNQRADIPFIKCIPPHQFKNRIAICILIQLPRCQRGIINTKRHHDPVCWALPMCIRNQYTI